jgi:SOS-response transcriptional repressor LexA
MSKTFELTERQVEVVRAIRKLQRSLRRAPTQRAVAQEIGTIGRRGVCHVVAKLANKGAVDVYGKSSRIKFYDLKA